MKLNWSHVTQYYSAEMVQSMHQFFSKTLPTKPSRKSEKEYRKIAKCPNKYQSYENFPLAQKIDMKHRK